MSDKPINKGGCPTLEEQAENAHSKAYVRVQKQLARNTTKASDILTWLLVGIHEATNPANKGKQDAEGKDIYQPNKYKENTQLSVVKEVLANNKDFVKSKEELKRAEKALAKQSKQENLDDEEESFEIELSLSADPVEDTSKLN